MSDDFKLLREYAEHGSDEAFRELVERHSGMVHAAALRIVREEDQAREVTQAVFLILARKAPKLSGTTLLAGWLYRTARFAALESLRAEKRRQQHYEEYAQMNATPPEAPAWKQIAPVLDEAMSRLREADRDAIVLRFFEEKPFQEVGTLLGISEANAKMRVGRALEKLRTGLGRKGIVLPAATLLSLLSAQGASATPSAFAQSIATLALAGEAAGKPSTLLLAKSVLHRMAWGQIKSGLAACGLGLALVLGVVLARSRHRELPVTSPVTVATLDPMAGEWEGTFESHGGDPRTTLTQNVVLSIKSDRGGRACAIEMRLLNGGRATSVFHFEHALNGQGNRIATTDDPRIGRLLGEGTIADHFADPTNGNWRIGFRTVNSASGAYSDLRWIVHRRDELLIDRHDHMDPPQQPRELFSKLRLTRRVNTNLEG